MPSKDTKNFLMLILMASLWGPSFLFIKVAIEYIPPITLAFARVGIAALFLLIVLKFKKEKVPALGLIWKHFAIIGLFASAIPFCLFAVGEKYISSSLAAILNGTTPLSTLLLAHFFIESDRFTKPKFFGMLIGFCGLFILVAPSLLEASATFLGILCILGATTCYGIGIVYTRKHVRGIKSIVTSTGQLISATIFLLPFSIFFDKSYAIEHVSIAAMFSALGLAIIGTGLAFILFYKIIEETSASYASNVTYIVPIFGMLLGVFVLDEHLNWNNYLGSLVIIFGVMIANGIIKFKKFL